MTDHSTPNKRGDLTLEFFPHPELDSLTSWFSCCLRLDDLDSFFAICRKAGIPEGCKRMPRQHPPNIESWEDDSPQLSIRTGRWCA